MQRGFMVRFSYGNRRIQQFRNLPRSQLRVLTIDMIVRSLPQADVGGGPSGDGALSRPCLLADGDSHLALRTIRFGGGITLHVRLGRYHSSSLSSIWRIHRLWGSNSASSMDARSSLVSRNPSPRIRLLANLL